MADPIQDIVQGEEIPKRGINYLRHCIEAYKHNVAFRDEQLAQYRKDLNLRIGEQWSDEDKAILKTAKKPCLTFNHIGGLVDLLAGIERDGRKMITAKPVDSDDIEDAGVVREALRYIDSQSGAEYEKSQASDDCFSMGEGIIGFTWDAEKSQYRVAAESVFSHVPDRDGTSRTWADSKWHFRRKWMTLAAIRNQWPEKVKELGQINPTYGWQKVSDGITWEGSNLYKYPTVGGSNASYEGDYNMNRLPEDMEPQKQREWTSFFKEDGEKYLVIECWQKVMIPTDFIYETLADGKKQLVSELPWGIDEDTGLLSQQSGKIQQFVDSTTMYSIKQRKAPKWRLTVIAGDVTLEDGLTIFRRLPYVPYYWGLKHDGKKKHVWGFVRRLADPQNAYNKMKSQELHAINTSTGFIMLLSKQLLRGTTPDKFEAALRNFNAIIAMESETMEEGKDYAIIKPGEAPYQLFQNSEKMSQEIVTLSGLDSQAMQGMADKGDPSGWALEVKQKQGNMSISTPFDNIRESTIVLYKEIVWPLLQNSSITMRIRRQKKIAGDDQQVQGMQTEQVPVNVPYADLNAKEILSMDIPEADIEQNPTRRANDLSKVDVDIIFDETQITQTERMRILTYLTNMQQSGIQVPPELLFEYMDEEVAQKMMSLMEQQKQQEAQMMEQQQQQPQGQGQPQGP